MGKTASKKTVVKGSAASKNGSKSATKATRSPAKSPAKTRVIAKAAVRAAPKPAKPARATAGTGAKSAAKVSPARPAAPAKVAGKPARKEEREIRTPKPLGTPSPAPTQSFGTRPFMQIEPANSSGDSKPKKNQAGLTIKELEHFRDLLLEKRRELVGDMSSMEREALQASESNLSTLPIHMADMGTDNYEQEFTLGLVEKDRNLLREINIALAKIQNGSYGICEGNGKPIAKVRLEAQPWARHSIEFARLQEKSGGGIRR